MFVVILRDPYDSKELRSVIGPFSDRTQAQVAVEEVRKTVTPDGGDLDPEIMELCSLARELESLKEDMGF